MGFQATIFADVNVAGNNFGVEQAAKASTETVSF